MLTGSGKTAAFVIPMLAFISSLPPFTDDNRHLGPYALIMAPTRELAQQIESEARKFASPLGFKCVSIVGGVRFVPFISISFSILTDLIPLHLTASSRRTTIQPPRRRRNHHRHPRPSQGRHRTARPRPLPMSVRRHGRSRSYGAPRIRSGSYIHPGRTPF